MLASFNHRRRMKAESRQIQKLAARLKFVLSTKNVLLFYSKKLRTSDFKRKKNFVKMEIRSKDSTYNQAISHLV